MLNDLGKNIILIYIKTYINSFNNGFFPIKNILV